MVWQPGGRAIPEFTQTDQAGNALDPSNPIPTGATMVQASSGNVGAAVAAASLPAVLGKTNYLSGVQILGAGATAASVVLATITGLLGGTMTVPVVVPAGVTTGLQPVNLSFFPPLPASAPNIAITVSVPSLGAGNTNAVANIQGFVK